MLVKLDDGAELFYKVDDFTDPWDEPETVVLHHGMAKSHKLWYAWAPIIARHYRVVRFDMRGMGQSSVPEPGYPWSVDNFANDLLEFLDKLELERVHLIGETVGGSIAMRFATLHQERLLSLTACTSPTSFDDPHHGESADLIEREGVGAWVENTIGRRLDPQIVPPEYTRWYAAQMAATPAHVVGGSSATPPATCAPCCLRSRPDLNPGGGQLAGGSAGRLPGCRRPVPQRAAGGLPRSLRIRPARLPVPLCPGVAGLCPEPEPIKDNR